MENINQIARDIQSIFETVCVISGEDELFFEGYGVLQEKLLSARQLISNIKLDPIADEIWDYSFSPDRTGQIIDLVNDKFDKLITWKPNIDSILEMSNQLKNDLTNFYNRQACIDRSYDIVEQITIDSLYKEIGQRAYKLDNNLSQIMSVLFERIEDEKIEQSLISEQFNFKLNLEKASHFAHLLSKMHELNFFTPANKEEGISDFEVLLAFGQLFKCDLFQHYMDSIDSNFIPLANFEVPNISETIISTTETTDFNGKPFPEFLLYPEKIKLAELIQKEFSQEKGKNLRLLLKVLENQNPPLITIGYRQGKSIYNAMQHYFNWNIGSYQSIFNYKIDEKADAQDLENISIRFKHILSAL